jgi:DNA-binding transcriptional LysR family regulator
MDTLELMRTFLAVVDAGGITAAGRRVGRSKALVSKHLGELEQRLGSRLINRTTRRVAVTEIGRAYAERARALVADLEALEDSVRSETTSPRGLIRLTAPQALGELALIEMVTAFKAAHPAVEIEMLLADRMVDLIGEGFDIALRISGLSDSSLIARKLCQTRLVLCAAPSVLANGRRPRRVEDLEGAVAVIDSNLKGREVWRFQNGGQPITVKVTPALTVNSAIAVRQALLAGVGYGLCPEFAVARDIREGRLVSLFEQAVDHPLFVHLVYPHRHHLSAKIRAFIDFSVNWYQPVPPWLKE